MSAPVQTLNAIPLIKQDYHAVSVNEIIESGDVRMQVIEYPQGYRYCDFPGRDSILFCIEGEIIFELEKGNKFRLTKGTSYVVQNSCAIIGSSASSQAKLMIISRNSTKRKKHEWSNPWRM